MNIQVSGIFSAAADFLLPDSCALCGKSLCLERYRSVAYLPLCSSCLASADAALLENFWKSSRCSRCGYPLTSESAECIPCREKEWNFNSSSSFFLYEEIGKDLICAYKFRNRKRLARYFAELIVKYQLLYRPDSVIVPVPFRAASKKKRGWDQIEQIMLEIEKTSDAGVSACLKRDNGPAQKTMDYSRRLKNLNNKIHLKKGFIAPKTALLVDDVFTTGATMDYCAKVLKKAGTIEVYALSLALDL